MVAEGLGVGAFEPVGLTAVGRQLVEPVLGLELVTVEIVTQRQAAQFR